MSLDQIGTALALPQLPLMVIYFYFSIQKIRAVQGSHVRYMAATWVVGSAAGLVLSFVIQTGIYAAQGDTIWSLMSAFCALVWMSAVKRHFDDDNWFNDQWKGLKRGLKKLRQRLASLSPIPSPA